MAQTANGIAFYEPSIGGYGGELAIPVPAFEGSDPQSFLIVARQFLTVEVAPDLVGDAEYADYLIEIGLPPELIDRLVERRRNQGDKASVYSHMSYEFLTNSTGGNKPRKSVRHGETVTLEGGFGLRTEAHENIPKGGGTVDLVCRCAVPYVYNGSVADADVMVGWWVEYT